MKNEEMLLIGAAGLFVIWKSGILQGVGAAVEGIGGVIGATGDILADGLRATEDIIKNIPSAVESTTNELVGLGATAGTIKIAAAATPITSIPTNALGGSKVLRTATYGGQTLAYAARGGGTTTARAVLAATPITSIPTTLLSQSQKVTQAIAGGGTAATRALLATTPITSIPTTIMRLLR